MGYRTIDDALKDLRKRKGSPSNPKYHSLSLEEKFKVVSWVGKLRSIADLADKIREAHFKVMRALTSAFPETFDIMQRGQAQLDNAVRLLKEEAEYLENLVGSHTS